MRIRILVLALLAALSLTSVALADKGRPAGKGKPERSSAPCKPTVSVILRGTLLSTSTDSFEMDVKRANRHGRMLKGKQTVKVGDGTKLKREGTEAKLADLKVGDRVQAHVRSCKRSGGGPVLVAKRVFAHPAKPAESASSGDHE